MRRIDRKITFGLILLTLMGLLILQCTDQPTGNRSADGKNVSIRIELPGVGLAANADVFRLVVSAQDMVTKEFRLRYVGGFITGEVEVPAGERRLFVLTAEESNLERIICDTVTINDTLRNVCDTPTTVIYQGSTVAPVIPDEVNPLRISMRPMVPMVTVAPHFQQVQSGNDFLATVRIFNVDSLRRINVILNPQALLDVYLDVNTISVTPNPALTTDLDFSYITDDPYVSFDISKRIVEQGQTGLVDRNGDATLAIIRYSAGAFVDPGTIPAIIPLRVDTAFDISGKPISTATIRTDTALVDLIPVPDFVVTFADSILERVVRNALFIQAGDIMRADVLRLQSLGFAEVGVNSLEGIQALENLTWLEMGYNNVSDLTPLAPLDRLITLYASGNQLTDISALSHLRALQTLEIGSNQIVDIRPLQSLTNLNTVRLQYNQISDILPLVNNTGLGANDTVDLTGNPLSVTSIETYLLQLREKGVTVIY
jgi:hypothetical protein